MPKKQDSDADGCNSDDDEDDDHESQKSLAHALHLDDLDGDSDDAPHDAHKFGQNATLKGRLHSIKVDALEELDHHNQELAFACEELHRQEVEWKERYIHAEEYNAKHHSEGRQQTAAASRLKLGVTAITTSKAQSNDRFEKQLEQTTEELRDLEQQLADVTSSFQVASEVAENSQEDIGQLETEVEYLYTEVSEAKIIMNQEYQANYKLHEEMEQLADSARALQLREVELRKELMEQAQLAVIEAGPQPAAGNRGLSEDVDLMRLEAERDEEAWSAMCARSAAANEKLVVERLQEEIRNGTGLSLDLRTAQVQEEMLARRVSVLGDEREVALKEAQQALASRGEVKVLQQELHSRTEEEQLEKRVAIVAKAELKQTKVEMVDLENATAKSLTSFQLDIRRMEEGGVASTSASASAAAELAQVRLETKALQKAISESNEASDRETKRLQEEVVSSKGEVTALASQLRSRTEVEGQLEERSTAVAGELAQTRTMLASMGDSVGSLQAAHLREEQMLVACRGEMVDLLAEVHTRSKPREEESRRSMVSFSALSEEEAQVRTLSAELRETQLQLAEYYASDVSDTQSFVSTATDLGQTRTLRDMKRGMLRDKLKAKLMPSLGFELMKDPAARIVELRNEIAELESAAAQEEGCSQESDATEAAPVWWKAAASMATTGVDNLVLHLSASYEADGTVDEAAGGGNKRALLAARRKNRASVKQGS